MVKDFVKTLVRGAYTLYFIPQMIQVNYPRSKDRGLAARSLVNYCSQHCHCSQLVTNPHKENGKVPRNTSVPSF